MYMTLVGYGLNQYLLTMVPSIEERVIISAQRFSERTLLLHVLD
jgi:hypothetical protein